MGWWGGFLGTRGEGQDEVVLMGILRCWIPAAFTYILIFHTHIFHLLER